MKMVTIIALCLFGWGCNAAPIKNSNPTTAAKIDVARAHIWDADARTKSVIPILGGKERETLKEVTQDHAKALTSLDQADTANAAQAAERAELANRLTTAQNALKAEQAHWIGYKTRKLLWFLATVWTILGIAGVVLKVFTPFGGAFTAGRTILQFLPMANPFSWIADHFGKTAAPAAPTPIAPVAVDAGDA